MVVITTDKMYENREWPWGGMTWENRGDHGAPHEANCLKLDCAKLKAAFGCRPRWHIREAVEKTVEWTRDWLAGEDVPAVMYWQIQVFLREDCR